jgi:hypothetical protein
MWPPCDENTCDTGKEYHGPNDGDNAPVAGQSTSIVKPSSEVAGQRLNATVVNLPKAMKLGERMLHLRSNGLTLLNPRPPAPRQRKQEKAKCGDK